MMSPVDHDLASLRTLTLPVIMVQDGVALRANQLHLLVIQLLIVHVEAHTVIIFDTDALLRLPLVWAHPVAHADVSSRHAGHPLVGAQALITHVAGLVHLNRVDLNKVAPVDHIHSDHRRPVRVLRAALVLSKAEIGRALRLLVEVNYMQRVHRHILVEQAVVRDAGCGTTHDVVH